MTTEGLGMNKKKPLYEIAYLTDGNETTFEYEGQLPSLPVPPLQQTLDRYLYWVKPHVTVEEYKVTEEIVEKFAQGLGQDLHKKLLARASSSKNWLEDWWLHYAYLTVREPILPLMNTTGPLPLNLSIWKPTNQEDEVSWRSALYLWSILDIYENLRNEQLKPQSSKEGDKFCMNQLRYVFNCTRLPGQEADSLYYLWKTKREGNCPDQVIVLCHGHIWSFRPWDAEGKPLTPPELRRQLNHIRKTSDQLGLGPGVPALTCDKREKWALNRDWLKSLSLKNMKYLDHIESAMFVYVLDDSSPPDFQQLCWEGLCGDTTNRWADKSMSCIITRNGLGTMNNDHTPYDAMASVVMCHYVVLMLEEMKGKWHGLKTVRDMPLPNLIEFDLDFKMLESISEAKKTGVEYCQNVAVKYYTFSEYGKDFLKLKKLHPDAYVQMALQLTYLRLHGKPPPTYETATARQFHHGRTETMRSCTPESTDWCYSMLNPNATAVEKQHKLVNAVRCHRAWVTECQKCEGVDRHMFGLYCTAVENGIELPEIFTDISYIKSGGGGNFVISSSTTGYTPIVGGVAPMVLDGYGCFYNILPNKINLFVSNFRSSNEASGDKFCDAFKTSLMEMHQILSVTSANL